MEEEDSEDDKNENENSFNPNFSFSVTELPSTPCREDRQRSFATAIAMSKGIKGSTFIKGANTSRGEKTFAFD